ncbi:MAG: hypothetical protein R3C20_05485 [Planctomycetaceae bacterium]
MKTIVPLVSFRYQRDVRLWWTTSEGLIVQRLRHIPIRELAVHWRLAVCLGALLQAEATASLFTAYAPSAAPATITQPNFDEDADGLSSANPASPNDQSTTTASEEPAESSLSMRLLETKCALSIFPARYTLALNVTMDVTNTSQQTLSVDASQFELLTGEANVRCVRAQVSGQANHVMQPGQNFTVVLSFNSIRYEPSEWPLVLKWSFENRSEFVDLNRQLRDAYPFDVERSGPGNAVAIIRSARSLDLLAMWPLHDHLQRLQADGTGRLVIAAIGSGEPDADEPVGTGVRSPFYDPRQYESEIRNGEDPADNTRDKSAGRILSFTTAAVHWLDALQSRSLTEAPATVVINTSPLKPFRNIELVGVIQQGDNLGAYPGLRPYSTENEAIQAATSSLFLYMPQPDVFKAMIEEDDRFRAAALESGIDTLTENQLEQLLQVVRNSEPQQRDTILPFLARVCRKDVVDTIVDVIESDDEADMAVVSLLANEHDSVDERVEQLWNDNKRNVRTEILNAAVKSGDSRWTPMLIDSACQLMYFLAAQQPNPLGVSSGRESVIATPGNSIANEVAPAPPGLSGSPDSEPSATSADHPVADNASLVTLRLLLGRLAAVTNPAVHAAARASLLEIRDPAAQEIVAQYISRAQSDEDASLIKQYLAVQLTAEQIDSTTSDLAALYPDPAWTSHLLRHLRSQKNSQPLTIRAVLKCANPSQVQEIVDQFDELPVHTRTDFLRYLMSIEFPGWRNLVMNWKGAPGASRREVLSTALDIFAVDASEESILMIAQLVDGELQAATESDDHASDYQHIDTMLRKCSALPHPEIHRVLNRALRHRNKEVQRYAVTSMVTATRRSPAWSLLEAAHVKKKEHQYDEALEFTEQAVRADPMLGDALLQRASYLLRADRLTDALNDLVRANQLNPEEPATMNTLALTMVRLGQIEEGLKLANETLALDPDDFSNQYNTACTVARAAEATSDADLHQQRIEKAMELLQKSVNGGFDDLDHLENDPDMNVLHNHEQWPQIVARIRAIPVPPP